jgi:hypothetical protein
MARSRSLHGVVLSSVVLFGPGSARTQELATSTLSSPNQEALGLFGHQLSNAGDVDQDGVDDVIVGAHQEDPGSSPADAGRAYVFSGLDGSLLFQLSSPNEEASGFFGFSVSGAGDVDQDGFADLIVGASQEDPGASPAEAGRAYVFSGQDGSLLYQLASPNEEVGGRFGYSTRGAGDVDQDGFADVIVGAAIEDPGTSPSGAGRAYVFSGQDGSLLHQLASPHDEASGRFGTSVAGAGDVDQDGSADVIVGAIGELQAAGRAYVFDGQDGSLLFELVSPNQALSGSGPNLGYSVAAAGDVNQDGFADVIVGSQHEFAGPSPANAGRAFVFSGQDGSVLHELISPNEVLGGHFGASVDGAGDVDGDGVPDVIVGAYVEDPGGSVDAGSAYVFSGQDGSLLLQLASPTQEVGGRFGSSVAGLGDVNGDGLADVIVGAPNEDPGSAPADAGRSHLFVSGTTVQELIVNGGFEGGSCSPWVIAGTGASCMAAGPQPHTGAGYAQLAGNSSGGRAYQLVAIPPGSPADLTFWLNVTSQETTTTLQNDRLFVEVRDPSNVLLATLGTSSNLDKTTPGNYSQKAFSMGAFAGQSVRLMFRIQSNATLNTVFRVDDVSLQ